VPHSSLCIICSGGCCDSLITYWYWVQDRQQWFHESSNRGILKYISFVIFVEPYIWQKRCILEYLDYSIHETIVVCLEPSNPVPCEWITPTNQPLQIIHKEEWGTTSNVTNFTNYPSVHITSSFNFSSFVEQIFLLFGELHVPFIFFLGDIPFIFIVFAGWIYYTFVIIFVLTMLSVLRSSSFQFYLLTAIIFSVLLHAIILVLTCVILPVFVYYNSFLIYYVASSNLMYISDSTYI